MKEPLSEDLLSAYLDGELSADERTRVERRLERDPQARERLEEFRRLSQIFDGLPRMELPVEFSSQVLHRAERQMLIPEIGARPRRRVTRWLVGLALPFAAAAILMTIQALEPKQDQKPAGPEVANNRFAPPMRGEPAANGRADEGALGGSQGDLVAGSGGTESFSDAAPSSAGEPAAAPDAASVSRLNAGFGGGGGLAPGGSVNSPAELDPQLAALGETIKELTLSADGERPIPVVTIYVADRAAGLILVQRVLEDYNVRPESEGEAADKEINAREKERAIPARDDDALFVVAEPEQVILAFSKILERDHPGLRWQVEAPIEVAALDREAKQRFDDMLRELAAPHALSRESPAAKIARRGKSSDEEVNEKPVVDAKRKDKESNKAASADTKSKVAAPDETNKDAGQDSKTARRRDSSEPQDAPADGKEISDRIAPERELNPGRQVRGPIPRGLEQLAGSASKKVSRSVRTADSAKPANRSAKAPPADEKPPAAADNLTRRSEGFVRVLIRVESERAPAVPAKAGN